MSSRTLPRSLRVTSAAILLAAATVVVIVAIGIATIPALIIGACSALLAGFASTMLLSEEIRDLRRRWAKERARDARTVADREREKIAADASFRDAVSQRLRANQAEIAHLRDDLVAGSTQINELEERLAAEQELAALFGTRPEIDSDMVSPTLEVDTDGVVSHLRSA